MALGRYVVTTAVTVAAGTPATVVAGEPGTGGAAGYGSAPVTGVTIWPVTYLPQTVMWLDSAGPLYAAIGAGNLRAFVDGQDTAGHAALAN
jgi:hypothetical protein